MGVLDRFRAWFSRAEQKANELDYAMLDEVHRAETAIDERTGGRLYDAMEKADEEAGDVLDYLGLGDEPEEGLVDEGDEGQPEERPPVGGGPGGS